MKVSVLFNTRDIRMDIFCASWVTKGLCLEVHVCGDFFSCIYNLEIFLSNNLLIPVKLLGY